MIDFHALCLYDHHGRKTEGRHLVGPPIRESNKQPTRKTPLTG